MRVTAVILAAGRARRMGAGENKAFLLLGAVPILRRAIGAFLESARIGEFVVVARPGEEERVRGLLPTFGTTIRVVQGGEHRRDSALAGVGAATGDLVLIHDGARPFPSPELIERVIDGTERHGACIPVLPITDTVRFKGEGDCLGDRTLDRSRMVRIQTPQGFRTSLIRRALDLSPATIPDDADAVLALGEPVWTVPGEATNLKITSPDDLLLANAIDERLAES